MFEKHEIWERIEDYIVIYVVFRDLDTDLYHVQQANFVARDAELEQVRQTFASHDRYSVEVFGMQLPSDHLRGFATLKQAVEAHKQDFADMAPFGEQ